MIILLTIAGVLFGWIITDLVALFVTKNNTPWFYTISGGYIGGSIAYAYVSNLCLVAI